MELRSRKQQGREISLNMVLATDSSGNVLTLVDTLEAPDTTADRLTGEAERGEVRMVLAALTETERTVINYRFGLTGEKWLMQPEIARRMGLSQSHISRTEHGALRKMRKKIEQEERNAWTSLTPGCAIL